MRTYDECNWGITLARDKAAPNGRMDAHHQCPALSSERAKLRERAKLHQTRPCACTSPRVLVSTSSHRRLQLHNGRDKTRRPSAAAAASSSSTSSSSWHSPPPRFELEESLFASSSLTYVEWRAGSGSAGLSLLFHVQLPTHFRFHLPATIIAIHT